MDRRSSCSPMRVCRKTCLRRKVVLWKVILCVCVLWTASFTVTFIIQPPMSTPHVNGHVPRDVPFAEDTKDVLWRDEDLPGQTWGDRELIYKHFPKDANGGDFLRRSKSRLLHAQEVANRDRGFQVDRGFKVDRGFQADREIQVDRGFQASAKDRSRAGRKDLPLDRGNIAPPMNNKRRPSMDRDRTIHDRRPRVPIQQIDGRTKNTNNHNIQTRSDLRQSRVEDWDKSQDEIFIPEELRTDPNVDWDYKVNAVLSDGIALNRPVKDERPRECLPLTYTVSSLPNVTIVIPFYNEVPSLLLRTVFSILLRTPYSLIHEIIVVDDCSSMENLQRDLEKYLLRMDPKIRLLRNTERQGLIRTRQRAADMATGEVLVFLDSHTEPGERWAEPILEFLKEHPTAVVQPGLVHIDKDTLVFGKSGPPNMGRTSFSWDLAIRWMVPPNKVEPDFKPNKPYRVPSFLGCVMVVTRAFFNEMGGFDVAMDLWGGENHEMAFIAWMCGGGAYTHPCSRVGHLFRPLPYSQENEDQGIARNMARLAEVWMDDYAKIFYEAKRPPIHLTDNDYKAIQERRQLRESLGCKGFDYIFKHVAPDYPVPPADATFYGAIRPTPTDRRTNPKSPSCVGRYPDGSIVLFAAGCPGQNIVPQSHFYIDTRQRLRVEYKGGCVFVNETLKTLYTGQCMPVPNSMQGVWEVQEGKQRIGPDGNPVKNMSPKPLTYTHHGIQTCLTQSPLTKGRNKRLIMQPCAPKFNSQQAWSWSFNFGKTGLGPLHSTNRRD